MKNYFKEWNFWLGILGILGFWFLYAYVVSSIYSNPAERAGQFGDMFGGFNALVTALAFGALVYTIIQQKEQITMQREELGLQRKELKLTRKELKKSADAQEKSQKALNNQLEVNSIATMLSATQELIEINCKHINNLHRQEIGPNDISNLDVNGVNKFISMIEKRFKTAIISKDENKLCLVRNLKELRNLRLKYNTLYQILEKQYSITRYKMKKMDKTQCSESEEGQ